MSDVLDWQIVLVLFWLLPALWRGELALHWRLSESLALLGALATLALPALGIVPGLVALQLLIQLLAWTVLRFAHRYLATEPGQARFLRAMAWVLAGATLVIASHNWLVLLAGWGLVSMALRGLLTYYPDRPQACQAARREAVASWLSHAALLLAVLLFWIATGSLSLSAAGAPLHNPTHEMLRTLASLLVVLAVLIKTAQLPFHGWLIQVMEAPAPVSALLHAGVVNLGGIVLIKLAGLWQAVPMAAAALVVWGGLSAALACLIMQTRVSIKLRLAWSTCAQMGFMLLECGLGFHALALLHLLAHSVYKACAFLRSGDQVRLTSSQSLLPSSSTGLTGHVLQAALAVVILTGSTIAWQQAGVGLHLPPLLLLLIGLGLAPLCRRLLGIMLAIGMSQLYLLLHTVAGSLQPDQPVVLHAAIPVLVAVCFTLLYLVQPFLQRRPDSVLTRRSYAQAFAGLHLDEWWSRLTLARRPCQIAKAVPQLILARDSAHD